MLKEIVRFKKQELYETKQLIPAEDLLQQLPEEPPFNFESVLSQSGVNIVAEIKYRSPSRGIFDCQLSPCELAEVYFCNGARALSILTEQKYFGGKLKFLEEVGQQIELPLLRKDFIMDRYQLLEARIGGASAFLLIVHLWIPTELICSI